MLSDEQREIVSSPAAKHALVLAVAGSGKSHTMAERIAYLIEAIRVDPAHVIAVMFNKSASTEFAEKMAKRLGKRNSPDSVTYHRLGTLSLNRLTKAGLAPAWEFVANPNRARYFAAKVLERPCQLNGHKYPGMVADVFLGFVDRVKSDLSTPAEVWQKGDWESRYEWFVDWYGQYEKARANAQLRFFSDLIYDPLVLIQSSDKAAAVVADRYEHIIVDEFQDICESQYALIRAVAGSKARVMVVGDDDQTIYSWRGAKPSYILHDFVKDFPDAAQYRLTRTWRYGHALSCAANNVITHNTDRADKLCISGEHAPKTTLHLDWEENDGSTVIKVINKQRHAGLQLNDIAILVRAYSHSGATQFALLEAAIPFRLEGGDNASVLDNPWVVCLLGWMSVAAGRIAARSYVGEPDIGSIMELRKIFNTPNPGLTFEAMKELCSCVLAEPEDGVGFATFVQKRLKVQDGQIASRLHTKRMLWRKLRPLARKANQINPYHLLCELCDELQLEEVIKQVIPKEDEAEVQIALINAFKEYTRTQGGETLTAFLAHLDDLRSFSDRAKESTDAIHMTSLHRSKGLEWECVIMVGLSQGRFPLKSRRQSVLDDSWPEHIEAERRLFYVGMTRARKELYLLSPNDLQLHQWLRAGKTGSPPELSFKGTDASQFLYESNLYLASTMATMVNRPLNVKAACPEVYNQYLEQLGLPYRAIKI